MSGMMVQAWYTCVWGVSPILLRRSPQALSGCTTIFRSLQRCSIQVQVQALAGSLKNIQRLFPKPLLLCLGCVLRVVVLLEGEPSPQSEILSALEQVFINDLPVLCFVHLSLDSD